MRKKYMVGGLFSPQDADRIEDTLSQIDGVKGLQVNRKARTVEVEFEERVAGTDLVDHIESTLTSLGYSVLEEVGRG